MHDTLAGRLATFSRGLRADRLPAEVLDSVRRRVLDVLGLCVGAVDLPTSAAALGYLADQGGRPQAHAIGCPDRVPATLAAFANGVLAHSLDYDDTHLPSILHPSASVVPAALAAAELNHASGREVVAAVAAGLEVCVRIGMAGYDRVARNSVFFEHGQHATSICGAVGGAVAAALLLGLDEDGVVHAIGLASSMASGIIESNRTGGTAKRMHCGWAAHSAVSAAQLVRRGFTGPPTVLEGRFGFFQAFLRGQYDERALIDGLGMTWNVPKIFFKPYPANHFTHAAIDAGRALRHQVRPDELASVKLLVAEQVIRTIGEPIEQKRAPETGYQAQFSGPYAVVAGLLESDGVGVGVADFTDDLACDPQRRALMAKVTVEPDSRCTDIFPYQFPAIVSARTVRGREYTKEVLANRGSPEWPLTEGELARKFRDVVGHRLPAAILDQVEAAVLRLDELDDLAPLLALLSTPI